MAITDTIEGAQKSWHIKSRSDNIENSILLSTYYYVYDYFSFAISANIENGNVHDIGTWLGGC